MLLSWLKKTHLSIERIVFIINLMYNLLGQIGIGLCILLSRYVCTYHTSGVVFLHNKISWWVKDCWWLALYVFFSPSYISLSSSSRWVKNMSKFFTCFSPKHNIQSNAINNIKHSKMYFMLCVHENRPSLDAYILGTMTDKRMMTLQIDKYGGKL